MPPPNAVISPQRLLEQLTVSSAPEPPPSGDAATAFTAVQEAATATDRGEKTAVLIVHGISPIQRYAMQDQFADGLLSYLKSDAANRKTGQQWISSLMWPAAPAGAGLKPSAVRIHLPPPEREQPEADAPQHDAPYYDVYEGYWSPFTKRKTSIPSLLQWLFNATFLATSSTAAISATKRKLAWDFGYVLALFGLMSGLVALALWSVTKAWPTFKDAFPPADGAASPSPSAAAPATISGLLAEAAKIPGHGWAQLIATLVIAYLIAQLVNTVWHRRVTRERTTELRRGLSAKGTFRAVSDRVAAWHRATAWGLAIILGIVSVVDWYFIAHRQLGAIAVAWWVVLSVLAVQSARALGTFVVEDILGDVQVYTTHDSNAEFFALRGQVIDAVATALLGVLNAKPGYDRIHIAGHSLGSTVALDVLMRVAMLTRQDPTLEAAFQRIRSFITFGTALEKTRFFFDVRNPTVSAAHDQWDADVFGQYFTDSPKALTLPAGPEAGIYWRNVWYARDIVANEICSYTSDVAVGADFSNWHFGGTKSRPLCDNGPKGANGSTALEHRKPLAAFVHGDYLSDPKYWAIAGQIITA